MSQRPSKRATNSPILPTGKKSKNVEEDPIIHQTHKVQFDSKVHGYSYEDSSDAKINSANLTCVGMSYLPQCESQNRTDSIRTVYLKDSNNDVAQIKLYEKQPLVAQFKVNDIVHVSPFQVNKMKQKEGQPSTVKYELKTNSVMNIIRNDDFLAIQPPERRLNSYAELAYCYSECKLRFMHLNPKKEDVNYTVQSLLFETSDKKRVQISFWNSDVMILESFELSMNQIYQISGCTLSKQISNYFDISLNGHESTNFELIANQEEEEPEILQSLSEFNKIRENKEIDCWRKGTFIMITDAYEDHINHMVDFGIKDNSAQINGKTLVIRGGCSMAEVKLHKGDRFSAHIRVQDQDNGKLHAILTHVNVMETGCDTKGLFKFI